jgi:hypothetical protein
MTLEQNCQELINLLDQEQRKLDKKRKDAMRAINLVLGD